MERDRYGWALDPADVRPVADVVAGLELELAHFSRPYMPFLTVPPALARVAAALP